MATTPDIFVDNDLVPDPHNALYSPRVLGRDGNYINFINNTNFFNDTWLMNTNNEPGDSGNFDDHTYLLDAEVGHARSGFLFSVQLLTWFYISTSPTEFNIEEDVEYCWLWFAADLELVNGTRYNMGWCLLQKNLMSPGTYYPNGNAYFFDFFIYHNDFGVLMGVTKTNGNIILRRIDNEVSYVLIPEGSGSTVVIPDEPDGGVVPNFEIPPTPVAGSLRPEGFEQSNLICCGSNNDIMYSRRCSVINGRYGFITPFPSKNYEDNNNYWAHGQYNSHVIGGIYNIYTYYQFSNRLRVHCDNGMHVIGGDIVSDRLSDIDLKDNKVKVKDATKKINKIKNVSFEWNDKQQNYTGKDIGFIAQNIEKIIPEAVQNRKNGFKGVQYHKVIPLLVASIQEKQKRIEILKEKIESFKNGKL